MGLIAARANRPSQGRFRPLVASLAIARGGRYTGVMALKLKTFRIGSKPAPGAGIRLGVVRLLPRGVKKSDYQKLGLFDLWFPALAPSRELFATRQRSLLERYRAEVLGRAESRQTLRFLAEVAKKTPISIGCYCEDESKCHRGVLAALLRQAAEGKLRD
jgi:uncharacterized protein YeaO (DUF488 family)